MRVPSIFSRRRSFTAAIGVSMLTLFALALATNARDWRPPLPDAPRALRDERGAKVALPRTVGTQAVFMGIGVGEYLIVTRDPSNILTSPTDANLRIINSSLMRRAFPSLERLRTTLNLDETGTANIEVLLLERPDVVVTWSRLAEGFERVGLVTVGLAPISSVDRFTQNASIFADIVGRPERAGDLLARSRDARAEIAREVAKRTNGKTGLLIIAQIGGGLWRMGFGFNDLIAQAGGVSLAGGPIRASSAPRICSCSRLKSSSSSATKKSGPRRRQF